MRPSTDRPADPHAWRDDVRRAARAYLIGLRHYKGADGTAPTPSALRAIVVRAARLALASPPGDVPICRIEVQGEDGPAVEVLQGVPHAYLLRSAIDRSPVDLRGDIMAESFMAEVQSVLDAELPDTARPREVVDPEGGLRRPGSGTMDR